MYCEIFLNNYSNTQFSQIIGISDNTLNNRIVQEVSNTNFFLRTQSFFNGNGIGAISKQPVALGKHKLLTTYQGSNLKFFLNGELVGQQTSALIGNNFLSFFVGKLQTSASDINFNNGIKSSALFTRTLSDQEAINLTKLN
jgi:hypothetical protein